MTHLPTGPNLVVPKRAFTEICNTDVVSNASILASTFINNFLNRKLDKVSEQEFKAIS